MNRIAFAIIACLFSFAASAETIDLFESPGFGNLKQFHGVANSAGFQTDADGNPVYDDYGNAVPVLAIDIYMSMTSPSIFVSINGVSCISPDGDTSDNIAGVVLACDDGSSIIFSADLTSRRYQVNSGRAHMWVTRWTLTDGLIER